MKKIFVILMLIFVVISTISLTGCIGEGDDDTDSGCGCTSCDDSVVGGAGEDSNTNENNYGK